MKRDRTVVEQVRAWEKRFNAKQESLRRKGKPVRFRITNRFGESAREAKAVLDHVYKDGPALSQSAMAAFKESYKRNTKKISGL